MPNIVDHAERRREVLDATWRVIGREGLEATTVRRIAQEAGYSIGVLAHYFEDKEDILISAHRLAFARARQRIIDATRELRGLAALRAAVLEALPLDAERHLEAQVDISFLGQMVGNAHLQEVRSASNAGSRVLWGGFLAQAVEAGEVSAEEDVELLVDEVMGLIESLSTQALINPERTTPEHQLRLVDRLLGRIAV